MLYQLGVVTFEVAPVNVEKVTRDVGHDFAAKDIVGAQRPRESVGEADEKINMSGCLFPQRLGGLSGLELLEQMAISGEPQMLVRGDGRVFGWYFIEHMREDSAYLDRNGVGRKIDFTIDLVKSPSAPSVFSMLKTLFNLFR